MWDLHFQSSHAFAPAGLVGEKILFSSAITRCCGLKTSKVSESIDSEECWNTNVEPIR